MVDADLVSTGMPLASALNLFHTFMLASVNEALVEAKDNELESVSDGGVDGSDAPCCTSESVFCVSRFGGTTVSESPEGYSDKVVESICVVGGRVSAEACEDSIYCLCASAVAREGESFVVLLATV